MRALVVRVRVTPDLRQIDEWAYVPSVLREEFVVWIAACMRLRKEHA